LQLSIIFGIIPDSFSDVFKVSTNSSHRVRIPTEKAIASKVGAGTVAQGAKGAKLVVSNVFRITINIILVSGRHKIK